MSQFLTRDLQPAEKEESIADCSGVMKPVILLACRRDPLQRPLLKPYERCHATGDGGQGQTGLWLLPEAVTHPA